MSFGNSITITVNAVAKVLPKINTDNFGSVYRLYESTGYFELQIRNSKESPQKDGRAFDRHNVTLTQVVYATPTTPEYTRIAQSTFRNLSDDPFVQVGYLTAAFVDWLDLAGTQADLISWQN
jgi:hypothetical protein